MLNFTIPQGATGATGPQGPQGEQGPAGTAATSSSLWATNPTVTLAANGTVPLTASYNSPDSGITVSGDTVTLPAGTYLVNYSANAESGGTGAEDNSVITALAAKVNGTVVPTSQSTAIQDRGDTTPLSSTFLVNASGSTPLQLVNNTSTPYSTNYSNVNLTVVRLA